MKKWTDEFIADVLYGLPAYSEYRWQVQHELEDHLTSLVLDLEDAGYSPQDAQDRALILMGPPKELNRSYRLRFVQRQLMDPFYALGRFFALALLTGGYYVLVAFLLGKLGFTADAVFAGKVCYPLYGHPLHQLIFSGTLFTVSFSLNALHLRRAFRLHPHPGVMITTGLLFTWCCEKIALFALSSLLCGVSVVDIFFGGWSDVAPWLNFPYILLTFSGCFALGALFTPFPVPGGDSP